MLWHSNIEQTIIKTDNKGNKKEVTIVVPQIELRRVIFKLKNKINGKEYYSYQLPIPRDFLMLVQQDKPGYTTQLIEKSNTWYQIKSDSNNLNSVSNLDWIYGKYPITEDDIDEYLNETFNVKITLPKKKMLYLQAYDEYLNAMDELDKMHTDKKYGVMPLVVDMQLYPKYNLNNKDMPITPVYVLNLSIGIASISPNLYKEFEKLYDGIPGWLKILTDE